ncbi:unnamed protein product [Protopolystoma xenopodis]|uniref:Uncharacterized protein n=1 Tax=Protopolystoma xenopodis TaxID=117903 RepID=A0A3S5ATP4_9PLAT|nr:unnamed protein product [Protopolystoma xenopodis]
MAKFTDDTDYDAGKTFWNVPRPRFNFGNVDADNGLGTRSQFAANNQALATLHFFLPSVANPTLVHIPPQLSIVSSGLDTVCQNYMTSKSREEDGQRWASTYASPSITGRDPSESRPIDLLMGESNTLLARVTEVKIVQHSVPLESLWLSSHLL